MKIYEPLNAPPKSPALRKALVAFIAALPFAAAFLGAPHNY